MGISRFAPFLLALLVFAVLGQRLAGTVLGVVQDQSPEPGVELTAVERRARSVYREAVHLPRRANGHFFAEILVDGARVQVLVDTGATSLMLRDSDAAAAGIFTSPSDFTISVATANGSTEIAQGRVREVELGPFRVANVAIGIGHDDDLPISLLGMNVLSRLGRIRFDDSELVVEANP